MRLSVDRYATLKANAHPAQWKALLSSYRPAARDPREHDGNGDR
jgi:hypothetical protein